LGKILKNIHKRNNNNQKHQRGAARSIGFKKVTTEPVKGTEKVFTPLINLSREQIKKREATLSNSAF
jgi:hypothetical protein